MIDAEEVGEGVSAHSRPLTTNFGSNLAANTSSVGEPIQSVGKGRSGCRRSPTDSLVEASTTPSSPAPSSLCSTTPGPQAGPPKQDSKCFVARHGGPGPHVAGSSGTGPASTMSPRTPVADNVLTPPTAVTGAVCCRDFTEGIVSRVIFYATLLISTLSEPATDDGQSAAPGCRVKSQSLQIAAKMIHTHIRRPGEHSCDSKLEEQDLEPLHTCAHCAVPDAILPVPNNEEDLDVKADTQNNEQPTGVLGIILDLYKTNADILLNASSSETSPARSPSCSSSKASSVHRRSAQQMCPRTDTFDSNTTFGRNMSASTAVQPWTSSNASSSTKGKRRPRGARLNTKEQLMRHQEQTVSRVSEAIRAHIVRQMFLMKLCRALMTYGAPTHRLEA